MGCLTLSFANIDKDDIEQGQSWRAADQRADQPLPTESILTEKDYVSLKINFLRYDSLFLPVWDFKKIIYIIYLHGSLVDIWK